MQTSRGKMVIKHLLMRDISMYGTWHMVATNHLVFKESICEASEHSSTYATN